MSAWEHGSSTIDDTTCATHAKFSVEDHGWVRCVVLVVEIAWVWALEVVPQRELSGYSRPAHQEPPRVTARSRSASVLHVLLMSQHGLQLVGMNELQ